MFLTDGEATEGETDSARLRAAVRAANSQHSVPVYGLAFGTGSDYKLVRQLAQDSGALARRIYEGSDAALQLEDFYGQLANPLLADVKFEYQGLVNQSTVSRPRYCTVTVIVFRFSSHAFAGKYLYFAGILH